MPALTRIGTLRNKFAHISNVTTISEIDPKSLFDTLTPQRSSRLKSAIRASIAAVPKGMRLEGQIRTRIEVCLFFAEIRTSLIEEQHRIEKKA
jgi:hypothetical protein